MAANPEPFPASRQIRRSGELKPWSIAGLVDNILETCDRANVLVTTRPYRFIELDDQDFIPSWIRTKVQDVLTRQWNMKIPFVQSAPPSYHAAKILQHHINLLEGQSTATTVSPFVRSQSHLSHPASQISSSVAPSYKIIDFCSGGGGPIPAIEKLLNASRRGYGQQPLRFEISDLHPHLDAWKDLARQSPNLGFISKSVDAANPPASVVSSTDTRVFRTYFLAFHHLPDAAALAALRSTLSTSDGFAIFELQDRRITSFVLMVLEFFLVYALSLWWVVTEGDIMAVLLTWAVPILPIIMSFDGAMSSMRTRTFQEVMEMVDLAMDDTAMKLGSGVSDAGVRTRLTSMPMLSNDGGVNHKKAQRGKWTFEGGRQMVTFPFGYMNWVIGRRAAG